MPGLGRLLCSLCTKHCTFVFLLQTLRVHRATILAAALLQGCRVEELVLDQGGESANALPSPCAARPVG